MNWWLIIAILPVAWFLWWIGFVATKGMRIDKNKEREAKAKKIGIKLPKV